MIGHCYQKMIDRLSRTITSDMADPELARLGPLERLSIASSARSSLPSIMGDGEEGGGEATWTQESAQVVKEDEVDWKKKCQELQATLEEIRLKAESKLADLREKVRRAERKAYEAESKAQEMEEQFLDLKNRASPTNICICDLPFCFEHSQECTHKECVISSLSQQVEEQKRLRICDAKQVEDKASKIKEWVTNKLKELEEQNLHLKEQNHKCNVQLEFLKSRLTELSLLSPKIHHKQIGDPGSAEDSSRGSFEDNGESDDSLPHPETFDYSSQTLHHALKEQILMTHPDCHCSSVLPLKTNQNLSPNLLYASIDYSSKKRPQIPCQTMTEPPRIRLERKKYAPDTCLTPSTISTTSEQRFSEIDCPAWNRDSSRIDSGSADVGTPNSPEFDASFTNMSSHNLMPDDILNQRQFFQTSTSQVCQNKCLHTVCNETYPQNSMQHCYKNRPVTAPNSSLCSLNMKEYISPDNFSNKFDKNILTLENLPCSLSAYEGHICNPDELHDYAEIYTPNKESFKFCVENEGCESVVTDEVITCAKAPTPPLHRFPSWESRIYDVALNGINVSRDLLQTPQTDLSNNNKSNTSTEASNSNAAFTDLSIPVFATVNGRASQIRPVPFTGDSSDSSDNEDARVTMTTTSSQTTSGDTESSASAGATGNDSSPVDKKNFSNRRKMSNSTPPPCPTPASKYHTSVSSPMKQREMSTESVLSDDYAVPPDAISTDEVSMTLVDNRPSLHNTPTFYRKTFNLDDTPKKEPIEKSGYLTKLGGKFKTWRRRWFVLRNGTLSYYKSQTDVNRKPQGQIVLDDVCRVNRAQDAATFEISTGKRIYYLTADSINMMEEWIKVLQNVLRQNATKLLLKKDKPTIEGWLTKVKHGRARRSWCVLVGRMFLYFKTPNDCNPLGQINMRDARVEEVSHVSDSDEEDNEHNNITKSEYTLGIFPNHQGPTYLLMDNKQEMDAWLYNLTVVSSGHNLTGTQYEQLIAKLLEVDGEENCPVWKHPLLLYTKDSISLPLTTLPSEQLQQEAIKLFKSIQLFVSVPMDTSGIEYHVALAQNSLLQCLIYPELQNELFCQLIKQTSRHCHQKSGVQQLIICATQSLFMCDTSSAEKGSSVSTGNTDKSVPSESKLNPAPFVFIQTWQLLSLAVSLFLPKNRTLWYLRIHLQRNANTKFEAGKYAIFCQRALERALINGGRECKPSRMEVLSILMKNPYHHSLPHSIPVHFLNGTYQVFGFDGSTTIQEFIETVNREVGIRNCEYSGFALFSDDPIEKDLEHCLLKEAKLCDVISQWEQALRVQHLGKFENTKVLKLIYKNRITLRQNMKTETDKEKLLLVYQINEDIVEGKFPLSKELALELAGLLAQIEFGDYPNELHYGTDANAKPKLQLTQVIDHFLPKNFKNIIADKKITDSIKEKWISLKGRNNMDCVRIYLNCTRKWSFTGGKLFPAKLKCDIMQSVWLVVAENCIAVLDTMTMQCLAQYPYSSVMTFGGCRDDFMLVINLGDSSSERNRCSTERLLFNMTKPKILEITLLIADYMNAIAQSMHQNKRSASDVPSSPKGSFSTVYHSEKMHPKIRANHTASQSSNTTAGSIPIDSSPDHANLS